MEREKQNRAGRTMRLEEGVNLDFKLTIRAKNYLRILREILKIDKKVIQKFNKLGKVN